MGITAISCKRNNCPTRFSQRSTVASLGQSFAYRATNWTKQFLFSEAYFGGGNDYSSLFRDNLAWTAAVTACMVLILTAMQVCVAINGSKTTL
ncbi:hypothetical protein V8C43DRAFT_280599 [Trichoderma afarasin]